MWTTFEAVCCTVNENNFLPIVDIEFRLNVITYDYRSFRMHIQRNILYTFLCRLIHIVNLNRLCIENTKTTTTKRSWKDTKYISEIQHFDQNPSFDERKKTRQRWRRTKLVWNPLSHTFIFVGISFSRNQYPIIIFPLKILTILNIIR